MYAILYIGIRALCSKIIGSLALHIYASIYIKGVIVLCSYMHTAVHCMYIYVRITATCGCSVHAYGRACNKYTMCLHM